MGDKGTDFGKCLAVLGTGSDVGKSIVVTALCRIFHQLGMNVAPFKAQNMSNNSFVTLDGGEMGRAQIAQAEAAKLEPTVDMNPVLLKPCTDTGAQVIVHGRPQGMKEASQYFADTDALFGKAMESLDRLRSKHDMVVMEGAGSCAEINLRERDFVNFRIAHAADAPVILTADIDRGGVFAQVVGTLEILPEEDRRQVRGILINRFRGDARLFDDGIAWIEKRTGLPVLGLIPHFYHIEIDSEDGMPLDVTVDPPASPQPGQINVAVIRLPHISNFTDFNPLAREEAVTLHYLAKPRSLRGYDLVILPGTKNVRADLGWMRQVGWPNELSRHIQNGGSLGGVCGGYQMLGHEIDDPKGVEGEPGTTVGLKIIPASTTLHRDKILTRTKAVWQSEEQEVDGYEIHMGRTEPYEPVDPLLQVTSRNGQATHEAEGVSFDQGRIWGTYLHGLFDASGFRRAFLKRLAPDQAEHFVGESDESIAQFRDQQYDLLAEHFRSHLDMAQLRKIARID